jgi:hypothetical protein
MKKFFFLFFTFFVLAITGNIIAQSNEEGGNLIPPDNPYEDKIPFRFYLNPPIDNMQLAVINLDGYDNFDLGVDYAEPHMSINPLNPLQFFNAFNINGTHRTHDGYEWLYSAPNFGVSPAGDPLTAYDSLGNLYYETMYGSISGCKVIKSTDNGNTWTTAITAISGNDKNWMACDQTSGPYANYVYTVMTPGNFARSTNFGASFTTTKTFSGQTLPGMMVAVGPNVWNGNNISGGCVYVVTHGGTNSAGIYTFHVSTDGGLTFTQKSQQMYSGVIGTEIGGRSTVNGMRTRPYPMIAADNSWGPNRGRLYLVYATNDPPGSGNKPDVFCRYSTDMGATWSAALRVNDDINPATNHTYFPAIWCDKETGRLFVKFYDTRRCPTSDSMDVYATYSDDGGLTFAPNQRISNKTFKTKLSGSGSPPAYQGDYDAIASLGNQSLLVWTDFRNNNYNSFVGYFPDYAMLATSLRDSLANNNDSTYITVKVPSVKLYTSKVRFTYAVSPTPPSGSINLSFIGRDSLTSYPDSVKLRVKTQSNVTPGTYTITITGSGPRGIPVHKRTVNITVVPDIPVELASFSAEVNNNAVNLFWATATETNNYGFEVERMAITDKQVNGSQWTRIGFVKGNGTSTEVKTYQFTDNKISFAGVYSYRLKQIDFDGSYKYVKQTEVNVNNPLTYELAQNYPNPFNPSTTIKFSIPEAGNINLIVYDILGNEITRLIDGFRETGNYSISFDASKLSSGVYFYELKSNSFSKRLKMMITK